MRAQEKRAEAPVDVPPSPFATSGSAEGVADKAPAATVQGLGSADVAKPGGAAGDNLPGSDRATLEAVVEGEGKAGSEPKQETAVGEEVGGAPDQAMLKAGSEPVTPAKSSLAATGGAVTVPASPAASVPAGPATPDPAQKLKKQGSIRKMFRVFTPEGRRTMKEEKAAKKLAKQASSAGTRVGDLGGGVPPVPQPPPSPAAVPPSPPPQTPPPPSQPAFNEISPAPLGGESPGDPRRPVRSQDAVPVEISAAPLSSPQKSPSQPPQPVSEVTSPAPLGGDRRVADSKAGPEGLLGGPPTPAAVPRGGPRAASPSPTPGASGDQGPLGTGGGAGAEHTGKDAGTGKKAVQEAREGGALKESGPQGPAARPRSADEIVPDERFRRSFHEGAGTKEGPSPRAYTETSEFGDVKVLRPRPAVQASPEPSPRGRVGRTGGVPGAQAPARSNSGVCI